MNCFAEFVEIMETCLDNGHPAAYGWGDVVGQIGKECLKQCGEKALHAAAKALSLDCLPEYRRCEHER